MKRILLLYLPIEYTDNCFPRVSMLFCKGVLGVSSSRIIRKSSPNWDLSPVEMTIPMPFPPVTKVPWKATLDMSLICNFSGPWSLVWDVEFTPRNTNRGWVTNFHKSYKVESVNFRNFHYFSLYLLKFGIHKIISLYEENYENSYNNFS